MKPIDQWYISPEYGDCMRAVTASLLDLPMEAVPHFLLSKELFHDVQISFMWAHGWDFCGNRGGGINKLPLLESESINGFFQASVKSKLFNGNSHSVVMDINGIVVHDPSPAKNYQNIEVYGTKDLIYWTAYKKRTGSWTSYRNL